jgi:anthraniloyl-CoA monooxygenase
MKIVCVGGGPAGLYFAILAKLAHAAHDITVIERNPPGVTYGWGVVFWEDLLESLYRSDPVSAQEIFEAAVRWDQQEVHLRGQQALHVGGYGFSIGRDRLLDILTRRAQGLGVQVQFQREVEDLSGLGPADLVVACDGANSTVRRLQGEHFGTHIEEGRNKYIWLGTDKVFNAFTFAFEETPAGWLWFHGYHFRGDASTCIIECPRETWEGLGFDTLGPDETLRRLERIFQRHLAGHSLFHQRRELGRTPWLNFRRLTNERWHHGNVVLMGDAAHTTHFTIGSGTKLAILDAIELARQLGQHDDLHTALQAYEEARRTALRPIQDAARSSAEWFENVPSHVAQPTLGFAYSLFNRRGGASWYYPFYLATQTGALRPLVRSLHSARRWVRRGLPLKNAKSAEPTPGPAARTDTRPPMHT